jgi:hypothetical protein
VAPGLAGVVMTAPNPTEGVPLLAAMALLAAPDPAERMSLLTALNPTESMALLATPDPAERVPALNPSPTESMPLLTALRPDVTEAVPAKRMAFSTASDLTPTAFLVTPDLTEAVLNPVKRKAFSTASDLTPTALLVTPDLTEAVLVLNPAQSMAFFAAPDLTEAVLNLTESVAMAAQDPTMPKVGLPVPDEGDYKIRLVRPNYHVGAVDWCRVTATSSETLELPPPRTTTKETSGPSDDKSRTSASPSNNPNNHLKRRYPSACPSNGSGNLSALGSAQEGHLNLCPMASRYVRAAAGPLAKSESCPGLSTPLAGSAEERHHLIPLATLGHAASDPDLTGSQSLTASGSAE